MGKKYFLVGVLLDKFVTQDPIIKPLIELVRGSVRFAELCSVCQEGNFLKQSWRAFLQDELVLSFYFT